jgi:preprotein translocase subunit SecE
MGKVKDDAPAASTKAASKPSAVRDAGRRLAPFLGNLVRTDLYKPTQGWYARVWTAAGLGVLLAAGIYRFYETQMADVYSAPVRFGVPAALTAAFAWLVFRLVQFPPFVDFLVATEAEMNKVSWTSRDELKRATLVVLITVLLMAIYLFGVDFLWSWLLQRLGILQFSSSGFGSQAG